MLECILCGGVLALLGRLGVLLHLRCQGCGSDQSVTDDQGLVTDADVLAAHDWDANHFAGVTL